MTPTIVCPTHGRPGRVKAFGVLPDLPLCVAESQLSSYRAEYPDAEYLVHPDDLVGIAPKRQWLVDQLGDVFMIDDDVTKLVDMTVSAGEPAVVTDPDAVRDVIYRAFDMAAEVGAFLVGLNNWCDPTTFHPQKPLSLTGFVSGHALGLRAGSKLWFPNSTTMQTDDLYISALNAHFHRLCLRDLRYAFVNPATWVNPGGMASLRTTERLKANAANMREMFGGAIIAKVGTSRASIQHETQLVLQVPWA